MDERTHSWIAIRAILLLEDEGLSANLVSLLKPQAFKAFVGAWIPDQIDAKRGGSGSSTDNHVLKMEPYTGSQRERFVMEKPALLSEIGSYRLMAQFLTEDQSLDEAWWQNPYRGDVPKPGQHLPNRIMALSTMLKDLLLMGDPLIDHLIPGDIRFAQYMDMALRTPQELAVLYFFMLSHFVADVCMPCHCDARKLAAYDNGLHKELEKYWARGIGSRFEKKNILKCAQQADLLCLQVREVDAHFDLHFNAGPLPVLAKGHDEWLEAVYLCRASFAVASIMAPYRQYPYDNTVPSAPFAELFGGTREDLLLGISHVVLHDAVLNTAIFWKHLWTKISKD